MDAVFGQINQGEGITSSLRKVDASEMTHKNPGLRTGGAEAPPTGAKPRPSPGAKPAGFRAKKPSSKTLEGNKWTIVRRLTRCPLTAGKL